MNWPICFSILHRNVFVKCSPTTASTVPLTRGGFASGEA